MSQEIADLGATLSMGLIGLIWIAAQQCRIYSVPLTSDKIQRQVRLLTYQIFVISCSDAALRPIGEKPSGGCRADIRPLTVKGVAQLRARKLIVRSSHKVIRRELSLAWAGWEG